MLKEIKLNLKTIFYQASMDSKSFEKIIALKDYIKVFKIVLYTF